MFVNVGRFGVFRKLEDGWVPLPSIERIVSDSLKRYFQHTFANNLSNIGQSPSTDFGHSPKVSIELFAIWEQSRGTVSFHRLSPSLFLSLSLSRPSSECASLRESPRNLRVSLASVTASELFSWRFRSFTHRFEQPVFHRKDSVISTSMGQSKCSAFKVLSSHFNIFKQLFLFDLFVL